MKEVCLSNGFILWFSVFEAYSSTVCARYLCDSLNSLFFSEHYMVLVHFLFVVRIYTVLDVNQRQGLV
jgi:hypothetical protein